MTEESNQKEKIDGTIGKTLDSFGNQYTVVGKTHVRAWHVWFFLGLLAGVAGGVFLAANQKGKVEEGKAASARIPSRPNIVVIMTDDQDMRSLEATYIDAIGKTQKVMKNTYDLLVQKGITFSNSFAVTSLCCPSRATFLTGQYPHNHGVMNNGLDPAQGGYSRLYKNKQDTSWSSDAYKTLPVWLQNAGYRTAHIGKYLNGYGMPAHKSSPEEIPPGWSDWYGLVDVSTYNYERFTLNERGSSKDYNRQIDANAECDYYPGDLLCYQTDVLAKTAVDFIQRSATGTEPLFLVFAPLAIHSDLSEVLQKRFEFTVPAGRHKRTICNERNQVSWPPSFAEEEVSDKPAFIKALPPIAGDLLQKVTDAYCLRLETLRAVDDAVEAIVAALKAAGKYQDTIIVFTSDNGWMNGEHNIAHSKGFAYEESNKVPLVFSGKGIPQGIVRRELVANIDLAPTIVRLTRARADRVFDGKSLIPLLKNRQVAWRTHLLLESPMPQEEPGNEEFVSLRTADYLYVDYLNTGEKEFYNFISDQCHDADPYQLESQHESPCYRDTLAQFAGALADLRNCAGRRCWKAPPGVLFDDVTGE